MPKDYTLVLQGHQLRRITFNGLEKLLVVQTFYSRLNYNARISIDAAAGGPLMNKSVDEAYSLIEDMALNHYRWSSERTTQPKAIGRHDIDALSLIVANVDALTRRFDKLNVTPHVPPMLHVKFVAGHSATSCQLIASPSPESLMEQANYNNSFSQRPHNDPFSNTYNPSW